MIISVDCSGFIKNIYVKDYEKIKKGQPLFQLQELTGAHQVIKTVVAPEDGQLGLVSVSVGQYLV